jgi:hypothetical protein
MLFQPSRYHPEGPCTAVPQPNVFHFKLVMAFWILLLGLKFKVLAVLCIPTCAATHVSDAVLVHCGQSSIWKADHARLG